MEKNRPFKTRHRSRLGSLRLQTGLAPGIDRPRIANGKTEPTILFRVEKLQSKNPFFQKAAGNGISILAYPCRLLEFGMLCAWSPYFHRIEIWFSTTANRETHNCGEGLRSKIRKARKAALFCNWQADEQPRARNRFALVQQKFAAEFFRKLLDSL